MYVTKRSDVLPIAVCMGSVIIEVVTKILFVLLQSNNYATKY